MEGRSFSDVDEFLDSAGSLLLADVGRNQLILGILGAVRRQPDLYESYEAWLVEEGGTPVAAASITAPWNLVLADAASHWSVRPLAETIAASASTIPGVVGNRPTVETFAEAWCDLEGCDFEIEFEQGVFDLERVNEVERPEGRSRPLLPEESAQAEEWWHAFATEADPEGPASDRIADMVARALDPGREQGLWVWDLHGRAVSMSGHTSFNFGGSRIGPVYTPPEHRRHGHGTALVADQSSYLLDRGLDHVYLYTDLSNPTSNAIYRAIGFNQIAESVRGRFSSGG